MDRTRLVRRAQTRPLVWLGEREGGSVAPPGERYPAYPFKEKDFVFEPPRRA
ncbi:MAG TPA: hypothetical protein VM582_09090 [Candidatus Thermoplasmatota archaeon]|nr:hypothetical protein [Candidatus Thermoplasmatota archaeon]